MVCQSGYLKDWWTEATKIITKSISISIFAVAANIMHANSMHTGQTLDPKTRAEFLACEFHLLPPVRIAFIYRNSMVTTQNFNSWFYNSLQPYISFLQLWSLCLASAKCLNFNCNPHSFDQNIATTFYISLSSLFSTTSPVACELTFDPNTAHKDLVLSKNNKEVTVSQSQDKCREQPELHPERFTHRRQLLCAQGLSAAAAERCYYEVEVRGEKAEIALAYRGMDRKSRMKSSAFGGNSKSWSLDRNRVYSVSHNDDSIELSTPPSHHRVGVYLNFKEGVLTFYEVSAENMTFLYRVEATFAEPLYPGFWLGDKCSIRLCGLRQEVNVVPTGWPGGDFCTKGVVLMCNPKVKTQKNNTLWQ